MARFMVLYYSTDSASELMANASQEQMKASMNEWKKWKDEASKRAKIEFGLPLQAVNLVTPEGITDSASKVSGYCIVDADSAAVALDVLRTHPQLKRSGSSMDVLEMLSMPGL